MNLATSELDEVDEDELETAWASDDAALNAAPSLDYSENGDDEQDAFDAEQEANDELDEGGFDAEVKIFQ